jgi:hypothetical protein
MSECSGIENDCGATSSSGVYCLDKLRFRIRLKMLNLESMSCGCRSSRRNMIGERRGSVDLRLSIAEQIEVHPRKK